MQASERFAKPASFSLTVRKSKNGLRNSLNPSRGSGQSIIQGIKQGPSEIERLASTEGSAQRLSRASPRWRWKRKQMAHWVAGPVNPKGSSQMGKRSGRALAYA